MVVALGVLSLAAAYLAWRLVAPFVTPLTWALALAVVADPLQVRLARRFRHRSVLAGLLSLVIALVLAGAFAYVGTLLANEAIAAASSLGDLVASEPWRPLVERHPWLDPIAAWVRERVQEGGYPQQAVEGGMGLARRLAAGSLQTTVEALVMVFFLFYFLRDRTRFLRGLARLLPLRRQESMRLLRDVATTVRAMVFGTLAVAALQGALGGLMFWWLGLPAAPLWGAVMAVLSILPMIGAALVWAPVAAYLALTGEWTHAAILAAWGALVIGLVDNLLKPMLVNQALRMHTVVVFVAVLGGLYAFGAAGVLLGPIVVAVVQGLLRAWRRRLRAQPS